MIEIPQNIALFADEFGKRWPVVGADERIGRERLAYQDVKVPVASNVFLIVEFEEGSQAAADSLVVTLRQHGYENIETEVVSKRHEIGDAGA